MRYSRDDVQALVKAGRLVEAERLCRAYCEKNESATDAWYLLGQINGRMQNYKIAAACFYHILKREPQSAEAYYNLGKLYSLERQHDSAAENFRQAFKLKPDFAEACASLATALFELDDLVNAESLYSQTLQLSPAFNNPYCYLSSPLEGQSDGSPCDTYRAYIYLCIGRVQRKSGKFEDACSSFQKALELKPDYADAHSNLLFVLSYYVLSSPQEMLRESQRWDRIQGRDGKDHIFTHPSSDDPDRRLRIGYVSPDLLHHPVSYFFEHVLAEHDRTQVEVYCYAEVKHPDAVTRRLQSDADHWCFTVGLSDEVLARQIFDDHIDILIDLAGHTAGNRLKVFAYKPAPIQVTYLGYCTTTGLATMDYWVTDEILHPPNTMELATESIYRLPRCWLCYRPADNAPPVAVIDHDKPITFGSLNELSKLTPAVIVCWSRILLSVPQSQLLIKTRVLANPAIQTQLLARFAEHGIAPQRLILLPRSNPYLDTYHNIDIALDPFPRTGGATTADALWMGVPVVTLSGERYIERQGGSMLTAVGLTELIATSMDGYMAKAVALANDRHRLSLIRASLRERMAKSPLCDGRGLAQALETAYRDMWKTCLVKNTEEH